MKMNAFSSEPDFADHDIKSKRKSHLGSQAGSHLGLNVSDPEGTYESSLLQLSLYNCSRNMGMSKKAIINSHNGFEEVAKKAKTFLDDIVTLVPNTLSLKLRNPCWKVKQPKLKHQGLNQSLSYKLSQNFPHPNFPERKFDKEALIFCLPFFFLAGFPKSGTTTVHDMLSVHPDIVAPSLKEPQWWTRGISGEFRAEKIISSFLSYVHFFQPLVYRIVESQAGHLITYDGSQSTLWDSNFDMEMQDYCATPAVLSHILPDAKFIVVMRNPVTRLYSNFLYSCTNKYSGYFNSWPHKIRESLAKIFHSRIEKLIEQFNNCTSTLSVFECASMRTNKEKDDSGCKLRKQRLTIGMYAVHVKKWLQFFPLKNFLFIRTEDLSKESEDVILNLTNFLGIDNAPEVMSKILKQHKNAHPSGVQPMDPNTFDLLERFYHPYNVKLAKLLNDERFLWKDRL